MNRRRFIKTGLLWLPAVGIVRAQTVNVSSSVMAGTVAQKPAGGGGGGACTTARDSQSGSYIDSYYAADTILGYASSFTAGATTTICKITFQLFIGSGTLNGTLKAAIYENNAGIPGTLVDESDTIAATTVTATTAATAQTISFSSGLSAAITASTTYRIAIIRSAGATGELGVNYMNNASFDSDINDAGSWSNYQTGQRIMFETFST